MKVKFNYKETIWFKVPLEIEIDEEKLDIDENEGIEQAIRDYIYSHYSTQELIDLSEDQGDPDTEIDLLEIKDYETKE